MKTSFSVIIASFACLAVLFGCNKEDLGGKEVESAKPIVLTKAETNVKNAANDFGFNVYHKIYEDKQILISPLSLSLALSMSAIGAEGETANQMRSVLGFSELSTEDMNSYYQKMVEALVEIDPTSTFEVANSIWANKTLPVKQTFIDKAKLYYNSEARTVDFSNASTLDAINSWCSEKTHGKIEKILDEMPKGMQMALLNALYFNAKWSFDFDSNTKKSDFTTVDKSKVKVDMMSARNDLEYSSVDGYQMVSLPYGNGAFSMKVILPPEILKFETAASKLDNNLYIQLKKNLSECDVDLKLPAFKFEYMKTLIEVLKSLGMEVAFSDFADFSGISEEDLKISMVIQKTYIDVNQKGTEAAAVTLIGKEYATAYPPTVPKVVNFIANRPFFFVIEENSTGSILFMGQKVN